MTTEYLKKFKLDMSRVLRLWGGAPPEARRRQLEILTRLQAGIARAELLRSMCELESQGTVFSSNPSYRDDMLKALGIENSSPKKELESLEAIVRDAMSLFEGTSNSNTTNAIRSAKISLRAQGQAPKSVVSEKAELSNLASGLVCKMVKPFLTWISMEAELNRKDDIERITAEHLHVVMREIERGICERNEQSYKSSKELTISDLEYSLVATKPQLSSDNDAASQQRISSRPGPWITTSQVLLALGTMSKKLPREDPVLHVQKGVVYTAIHDLYSWLKRFVALYIPCDYPHSVCYRIWGSMAQLNVCQNVLSSFSLTPFHGCQSIS